MTSEKLKDLELVSLKDYFDSKLMRLISPEASWASGGISEIPIIFNIHADLQKKLNFSTNKLQKLYGFAIITKKIAEINKSPYYPDKYNGCLRLLELNDCGETWIFKLEFIDNTTKLYSVQESDVIDLLNKSRKPADL